MRNRDSSDWLKRGNPADWLHSRLIFLLGGFLVDSHLSAVKAAASPPDGSRVGRAVGAKAGAFLDHAAPVFAAAGTVARPAALVLRHN